MSRRATNRPPVISGPATDDELTALQGLFLGNAPLSETCMPAAQVKAAAGRPTSTDLSAMTSAEAGDVLTVREFRGMRGGREDV